jgi:hypothetical protein
VYSIMNEVNPSAYPKLYWFFLNIIIQKIIN